MLGSQLKRIDDPQHFVEVAPRAHRISNHQLDQFVRADHIDVAHGGVIGRSAALGTARGVDGQHAIEFGNGPGRRSAGN